MEPGAFRIDEGGLLLANSFCRADIAGLFGVVERPTFAAPEEEDDPRFAVPVIGRLIIVLAGLLPVLLPMRPAVSPLVFIV